jgi:hypothetical protein
MASQPRTSIKQTASSIRSSAEYSLIKMHLPQKCFNIIAEYNKPSFLSFRKQLSIQLGNYKVVFTDTIQIPKCLKKFLKFILSVTAKHD